MASNPYFQNSNPVVAGQTARSGQVNATENAVQAGFDGVVGDVYQCFRTTGRTPAAGDMAITAAAGATVNKLIGFDATGAKIQLYPITPNPRGAWLTATNFALGDMVSEGPEQSLYYCLIPHTSGTFATDYANGDWIKIIDNTAAYQAKYNPQIITAASYNANPGDDLLVDVSSNAVTIVLPASPTLADNPIGITHLAGNIGTNNITVGHNGNVIMGTNADMIVNTTNASLMLGWSNATYGWRLIRGT